MIKIQIIREGQSFKSLKISGHANYDDYGKDLVCAGVSSIITGGINSIRDKKQFQLTLEEGLAEINLIGTLSNYDEAVINTIITSLETIEDSYPQYVKIKK